MRHSLQGRAGIVLSLLVLLAHGQVPAGDGPGHHSHAHDATPETIVGSAASVNQPLGRTGPAQARLVFDRRIGSLTLYFGGRDAAVASPIPSQTIVLDVVPLDHGFGAFRVELLPLTLQGDPEGRASRFVGTYGDLVGLDRFRATLVELPGQVATSASFEIDAARQAGSFVCPMRCEGPTSYDRSGRCPVCGMRLVLDTEAHGDHTPKHGGILFMAPDGWHHLEGVLVSREEFRLYLYNDFTRPIPAEPHSRGSFVLVADGENVTIARPLVPVAGRDYLTAALPAGVTLPLDLRLRLHIAGRKTPDRFDFRFEQVAGGD